MFSWLLIIAALWLPMIYLLGAQWSFFEQYHYGWVVPFMCAFFGWERLRTAPIASRPNCQRRAILLLAFIGIFYWFTRILQEANPIWRLASYGLACEVGGATLLLVYLTNGWNRTRHFIFPVAFFLIAVPWPSPLETVVIQNLTRLNALIVVELLNLFGVPAITIGNLIEISTGVVGVEEACSGIRSLQATLMITLFFGEFYHLRSVRRFGLVLAGIAFAMVSNICRTGFLVWVAARDGVDSIHKWHDPAGVFVLVICFLCTWLLARSLQTRGQLAAVNDTTSHGNSPPSMIQNPLPLALKVIVFIVLVEISTEAWFRMHETRHGNSITWSVGWPEKNETFQSNVLTPTAKGTLSYDTADVSAWMDAEDHWWQGFYLRWLPETHFYGRIRAAGAKEHRPEICLKAGGWALERELEPALFKMPFGPDVSFRRYLFQRNGKALYVFFAVIEDRAGETPESQFRKSHLERFRAALEGSRNFGQRNIEVAVTGFDSIDEAWKTFAAEFPGWIKVNQ